FDELSDTISIVPVPQGWTSPWKPASFSPPVDNFDSDPKMFDPWHVHLDLHRRYTMTEQNTQAKLKNLLKQEKIQLWNPPYTQEDNQPGDQHIQELAQRYAPFLNLSVTEVGGALESIRAQAVKRGKGNRTFRETSVATLELLLPRDAKKVELLEPDLCQEGGDHRGVQPETRQTDPERENSERGSVRISAEMFRTAAGSLIHAMSLHVLDKHLDEQGVKNHSKVMVLKVSDAEQINKEEEEKKNQNESIQRTQKGFQILSERDTTPFLEIADQKGNPLKIPHKEKKALILAMGFHEKGRSLMKRKQYDNALCHLLQADQQFSECGSALLSSVDNYAVLQLDIVWCYRALEALSCLEDGRSRLQRAEECFLKCYGEQQQRLLMIKVRASSPTLKETTVRLEFCFLKYVLMGPLVLIYPEGFFQLAHGSPNPLNVHSSCQCSGTRPLNVSDPDGTSRLTCVVPQVENLYGRLCPDSEKMAQLMALGFTEREARLGLRACGGDLQEAAIHISNRRQEREEVKQRERQKRTARMEAISSLMELGFSRRDAARALHHAEGNVDKAYSILLDSSQAAQTTLEDSVSPEKVEQ
ncbi:hypothetical protein XENOCAPTIV_006994, partial [Xenoophorus captivus]